MRIRSPASRGSFQFRVAKFDLFVAVITPWLALVVRDHNVFIDGRGTATVYYFTVSLFFSFCAFLLFRIRDGLSRFFSVHDAWAVVKAVILSELMTGMVLFTLTRLDGIPRSTPVIHALLLTAFLIGSRVAVRMLDRKSKPADLSQLLTEHIIMIGATARSSQYINFISAETPGRQEVVAVLDERAEMIGRSISGIKVEGLPERLSSLIAEYAEHGIRIDRVIIGDESGQTPKASLKNIRQVCRQSAIALDSLPALTRLKNLQPASPNVGRDMIKRFASSIETSRYFKIKRLVDFIAATILFIVLMPLILLVAIIVLFDVGSPLMFWQRRVGAEGRRFQLYKFRTLKPSYDRDGQPIPERSEEQY